MKNFILISALGTLLAIQSSLCAASSGSPPYGAILSGARHHHPNQGYCDYSNAAYNNGWGWNPVTNTPCAPQGDKGYCDFSSAQQNGGWGWNPVTRQSCR